MSRTIKQATKTDDSESLARVFFRGFFWPLRMIGKGLAWLGHRPPLKQIGHAIAWFFKLKPMRFLGRILGIGFIMGSWEELKHVTWPDRTEGRRLTTAVIIFSVIFGGLVAIVDFGLDKLFRDVLLK